MYIVFFIFRHCFLLDILPAIILFYTLLFLEFPPQTFSLEPNAGQYEKVNSEKLLYCRTNCNPSPEYRWLKDGRFITNLSTNYVLQISSIGLDDAGHYRCEASNKFGAILSSAAHLQVACKYIYSITVHLL